MNHQNPLQDAPQPVERNHVRPVAGARIWLGMRLEKQTVDADRRYTTGTTMNLCAKLAGVDAWDVDVAADEESHWAPKWYGVEQNGLVQPWFGRVWCNPPYSDKIGRAHV